ncbi:hypothetical protein [Janthinobacterium sp. 17J80-10]|uniref:hypothetical protein n=1 Tax=Janthinobacterium sp. 17J80-10 TaxID=2497863 RepID=UPI0010053B1B|nr:hypothetical protein [Janthinobacterium sp. 17J80-10]QAU33456.1 hypothetical protein EKL02_04240 [Janthinobacterium sp. 17J80-10]
MNKLAGPIMLCLVAGCSTTPHYDTKFGDAVRDARMRMTIDPDAGKKQEQLAGMDGKAAQESIVRYQNSFKEPPPVVNVINIGGAIGNGR